VLGEKSLKSLAQVRDTVDIVDIFRPGDEVYEVVKQAVALKPKAIWMQSGIKNMKAKKYAEKYNIIVVMDKCLGKEHYRLINKDKSGTLDSLIA
jgi:predicted CoA-binding protein